MQDEGATSAPETWVRQQLVVSVGVLQREGKIRLNARKAEDDARRAGERDTLRLSLSWHLDRMLRLDAGDADASTKA